MRNVTDDRTVRGKFELLVARNLIVKTSSGYKFVSMFDDLESIISQQQQQPKPRPQLTPRPQPTTQKPLINHEAQGASAA